MNISGSFRAEKYHLTEFTNDTAPTRRDFYKIWLVKDRGILEYGDCTLDLKQPALVFLHPLVTYKFVPIDKDRSGYWCIFTGEFLSGSTRFINLQNSALFDPDHAFVCFPDRIELSAFQFLFEQIISEHQSDYAYKLESIRNLTSCLIHQGQKMQSVTAPRSQQRASVRLTNLFLNLLEEQYPISSTEVPLLMKKPSDFADKLCVHTNHLNAAIQQVTGKSTSSHIADRMIAESRALLQYSDWTVADIAYSLGFDYPNHFTAFFKKHTGQTPLSLRN